MLKSILTMLFTIAVIYGICYYFAPNTTTSVIQAVETFIEGGQGQVDHVLNH